MEKYLNLRFLTVYYISKFSLLRQLQPLGSLKWAPRQMVLVNEIAENEHALLVVVRTDAVLEFPLHGAFIFSSMRELCDRF